MRIGSTLAAAAVLLAVAGAANADILKFTAVLRGGYEAPPNDARAKGEVDAELDTQTGLMTYTVNYAGLTGPAVATHFGGPDNNGLIALAPAGVDDPVGGTVKLTPTQVRDLNAGQWYFDVRTSAYPNGEIRGRFRREDF